MSKRASFAKAGAIALPIGLAVSAAQAESLVDIAGQMDQLSTFNDAVAAAGLEEKLAGEGPFTIFAPSNEAFEQLPGLSKLLEEGHQAELAKLLEHHLIAGKAVTAEDAGDGETAVDTAAGERLTIDASGGTLVVTQAGAPSTSVAEGTNMPVTEHQQEVLKPEVAEEARQTAADGGMPATEHQQEVLAEDQAGAGAGGAAGTAVTEGTDMPVTGHQQQVLRSNVEQDARQTAADGGMPATEHQQEVLAEGGEAAGETGGQTPMQSASVIEADVEADNGVIHVIDAVLVPRELSAALEQLKGGS